MESPTEMSKQSNQRGSMCLCCSDPATSQEWGMVSPFLASRALREEPSKTRLWRCKACGFAWCDRGLDEQEARLLYEGYRGDEYFRQRHAFEPWYSKAKNDSIGSESTMQARRAAMARTIGRALERAGSRPVGLVVDFGGDRGQMLRDLPDAEKWVYEYSGAEPESWAKSAASLEELKGKGDLAMACQVLEHVESPLLTAKQVVSIAKRGGWIYLEVPNEQWAQSMSGAPWRGRWLDAVAKRPLIHCGLDFLSTASRLALGWIPPFGFWSMREHLNFFTPHSLRSVAERAGIEVLLVEHNESGIALVGIKR